MDTVLSFEDSVRLGCVVEGSVVLGEEELELLSYALNNAFLSQDVEDYVASFDVHFALDRDFLGSARMLAEKVKNCHSGESFSRYVGPRQFQVLMELRNKMNVAGVNDDPLSLNLSRDLGLGSDFLSRLFNSGEPLKLFRESGLWWDVDSRVLSRLFFSRGLSVHDVVFLVKNLPFNFASDRVFGMNHFVLFLAVLLRNDWSKDELETLWDEWCGFLDEFEMNGLTYFLESFSNQILAVELLFAMHEGVSDELLWKLFDGGHSSEQYMRDQVRGAVVRNPAFDAEVMRAVVSNDVDRVGELLKKSSVSSVVGRDFAVLREAVVWNPVLSFGELEKIYNDENETAPVRFGALFNKNVPSFYHALYV